jgi:hypothetical protein
LNILVAIIVLLNKSEKTSVTNNIMIKFIISDKSINKYVHFIYIWVPKIATIYFEKINLKLKMFKVKEKSKNRKNNNISFII